MILKECSPVEPSVLWDEYKSYICDDLHHHLIQLQFEQPTEDLIYDYGLYLIEEALQESGKSLNNCLPMPMPVNNWNAIVGNWLIGEQRNYNVFRIISQQTQKTAHKAVMLRWMAQMMGVSDEVFIELASLQDDFFVCTCLF